MAATKLRAAADGAVFSRTKPEVYETSNGKVIVEDEFLNFISIKIKTLSQDEIILLASNNFSSDWIEHSKRLLFELCPTTQRNVKHKGAQKDINNIKDCLKVLNERGEDIPRFVSHFLDELPPVGFGNMDASALLGRIERLSREVSTLRGALGAQVSVSEGLGAAAAALDRRMTDIEEICGHSGRAGASSGSQESEKQGSVDPVRESVGAAVSAQAPLPAWSTVVKEGRRKPQKPPKVAMQPKPGGMQNRLKRERKMGIVGTGTVTGDLDDCSCDVETIDDFNNERLFPKLQTLLESDYFRFYKVNLNKACPFWGVRGQCGLKDCAVKPCSPNQVPEGIRSSQDQFSAEVNECEQTENLGAVDVSLSDETRAALLDWSEHDDEAERFCVLDDDESPDSQYVDLLLNPERFTGFRGPEAWRIWSSIYEENCFKPRSIKRPIVPASFHSSSESEAKVFYSWLEGQCVEKRAFYRLISGLHASINIHLSARYLLEDSWFQKKWGHNVSEFRQRFDSELTAGEGPKRLRSLYFLFLIQLRALAKALPFFQRPAFRLFTGRPEEDRRHKELLLHILRMARSFPLHFDETSLFAGDEKEAAQLKEDVRLAFLNISRIMDCVGCFKCRLWGKLQTQGLGTSLKILFSGRQIEAPPPSGGRRPGFQLRRQEVVSLLNAFGRVSTSIRELKSFRALLAEER